GGEEGGRAGAMGLPQVTVVLKAGGEKFGFLKDPDLLAYLERSHHLTIRPEKEGSVEMVRQPVAGLDAPWPASEYCRQEFESRAQREGIKFSSQDVFNSPLVVASWPPVAQALSQPSRGIVALRDGAYSVLDMDRMTKLMEKGASWKDLGLPLYGR